MNFCRLTFVFVALLLTTAGYSQQENGFIRGTIVDSLTNNPIFFAKVFVVGTASGATTDAEGNFSVTVAPGIYELRITVVPYRPVIITGVEVEAGKAVTLPGITMSEAVTTLGPVVITGGAIVQNSREGMERLERDAIHKIDGISNEDFKSIGDSELVGAMTRVPGVSVAGGKYIYVRGLGDRYNKTTLNGIDIPGLDPDRNTLQMDIFPTSLIDNVIVNKSAIAELPADFTGGVVDISLKSFPDERRRSFSFSSGYNPYYHFNSDYLTYDGGKTDFLGFDDGTRDIPAVSNIPFFSQAVGDPDGEKGLRYRQILESFNPTMAAYRDRSFMDYSIGTSFGNQYSLKKFTLGYNLVASYKNNTEYYEDAQFSRYGLAADPNITAMEMREMQVGDYGVNNVLMTGLAGIAIKTKRSKFSLTALHLQNGESKAGIFDYRNADQGAVFYGFQHNLEFSQRSLTNIHLTGKHFFTDTVKDKTWNLEWKLSPTLSKIQDPDIRFTRYEDRDSVYIISTESGFPERIWREMEERSLVGLFHVTKPFEFRDEKATLKFGGAYTYKERNFNVRSFALNVRNMNVTGDPNELFAAENLWPYNGDVTSGTTYEASFAPTNPNEFNANIRNIAGYVSTEISPMKRFKAIIGVRAEYYVQRYTGQDQLGTNVLDNEQVLDNLGIFPSTNLVYAVNENQNLRLSYGKTIARPSFKELSYAEIYDPITGRIFIGGLFRDANDATGTVYWDGNLVSTDIHNFDFGWQFLNDKSGNSLSVSSFYKKFFNPIEIVQFSAQAGAFQPRNVGDGQIYGIEFEMRQSLKPISKKLQAFTFSCNVTFAESSIELSQTEYESRVANARTGQTIDRYRDMAGQAPYIINAGLSYSGGEKGFLKGFEAGVYYNVQGPTLEFVGIVDRPDIYSNSFHSLNFNSTKTFGKDEQIQLGIKVDNILNDKKESVFQSFNASDEYFYRLAQGTTYQVKFSYNF
jgi:hypothetical protein